MVHTARHLASYGDTGPLDRLQPAFRGGRWSLGRVSLSFLLSKTEKHETGSPLSFYVRSSWVFEGEIVRGGFGGDQCPTFPTAVTSTPGTSLVFSCPFEKCCPGGKS